jgi:hypothetical protein
MSVLRSKVAPDPFPQFFLNTLYFITFLTVSFTSLSWQCSLWVWQSPGQLYSTWRSFSRKIPRQTIEDIHTYTMLNGRENSLRHLLGKFWGKQWKKLVIFLCYIKGAQAWEFFWVAFFALSEATCVCHLGSGEKNRIFIKWTLISKIYGFLPHTECAVNKKII